MGKVGNELRLAMMHAWEVALRSEDPSTQLGAIVLIEKVPKGHNVLVRGWNHLPQKTDSKIWHDREAKYRRVIHAEEHAILSAAHSGYSTQGATLICPMACCIKCAGVILTAGISHLVVESEAMRRVPERWRSEIEEAHALLAANGVQIGEVDLHPTEKPTTRFDGKLW